MAKQLPPLTQEEIQAAADEAWTAYLKDRQRLGFDEPGRVPSSFWHEKFTS